MKKAIYPNLFKPMKLNGLRLKNRVTMAPLYLGYAASGGTVSPLLLYHYKLMARSGAAMIVVENASVTAGGSGIPEPFVVITTGTCPVSKSLRNPS